VIPLFQVTTHGKRPGLLRAFFTGGGYANSELVTNAQRNAVVAGGVLGDGAAEVEGFRTVVGVAVFAAGEDLFGQASVNTGADRVAEHGVRVAVASVVADAQLLSSATEGTVDEDVVGHSHTGASADRAVVARAG